MVGFQISDSGPLDHAISPCECPVSVFHTFDRFLTAVLWTVKKVPSNIIRSLVQRQLKILFPKILFGNEVHILESNIFNSVDFAQCDASSKRLSLSVTI